MNIGKFNEVTSQVFKDYGFLKYGNQFYLNFDNVVIEVDRTGQDLKKVQRLFYILVALKIFIQIINLKNEKTSKICHTIFLLVNI